MRRTLLLFAASPIFVLACGPSWEEQNDAYTQCIVSETQALMAEASVTPVKADLVEIDETQLNEAVRTKLKEDARANLAGVQASQIASIRCEPKRPPPKSNGLFSGDDDEAASVSDSAPSGGGGASQVSGTNNQVAGVDEADFIKNDDKYMYVANGGHFRIIEAWPAAQMHELASIPLEGKVKKLFVHGNRAVVYSSPERSQTGPGYGYGGRPSGECTYGYACSFGGDGSATTISIFDITNRADPVLLRTHTTTSSLVAARRIGNTIHTVLSLGSSSSVGSGTSYVSGATEAEVRASYQSQLAEADRRIDAAQIAAVAPTFTADGLAPAQTLYRSTAPGGASFTTVFSMNLDGTESKMVSILSSPGAVYASADALYMAVPQQQLGGSYYASFGNAASELSSIHKFGLGESALATSYRGSGAVKGHVLNQFAMDEKDGKLRIATTAGQVPQDGVHSAITVLEEQPGTLVQSGIVDHIAPSEDIRSVRFDGERGYLVTFKKTDPLYVFDLSTPTNPRILGELKIPGFSTYMHMMDVTHLLTIGYDAADQGDFAYFTGVLLQIFDVSNPTDPKLTHKEVIGTRGSGSEALGNHLAFNYFAPKELLALPMTICEGGNDEGDFGSNMTFSGLMVYRATTTGGFELRGRVAHPRGPNASCNNWWTDASSDVRRSIVMDDFVFSVSEKRIKASSLGALDAPVAEVTIE